jgi:DNA-binding NarL/FixJ family response regulator
MSVRILLVDDNAKMRQAYRALLSKAPDMTVVGEVEDGDETLDAVLRLGPNLVLMDVEMKRVGGLTATRRLSEVRPEHPRVMMVSGHGDDLLVSEALRAGACGYLVKTRVATELLQAIRRVMAGETYVSGRPEGLPQPAEGPRRLSAVEERLVGLLAGGLTDAEAVEELGLARESFDGLLRGVLTRLALGTREELVRFAAPPHAERDVFGAAGNCE